MRKILFLFITFFLLTSCAKTEDLLNNNSTNTGNKETNNDVKKILQSHLVEEAETNKAKFDKTKTREKVLGMTGFLCYTGTQKIDFISLTINTKNCLEENGDEFINFKVDYNAIYKNTKKGTEKYIQVYEKKDTENIVTAINNNIPKTFSNLIDKKYCMSIKAEKGEKDLFINSKTREMYLIKTVGLYRKEGNKQLKKDPTTSICEGYYPGTNRFIIYDYSIPKYFIEAKKDILIDYNSLKYGDKVSK
ncbi:MAG: hypothetical protein PHN31_03260 [Candidatus Gracilibacteria bacterium]|nr:hypothetical protein [Candidatus Gracilibacteria bacterium]